MSKHSPTVQDIIAEYLTANGYDGLWSEDCACLKDDLAPCGETCMSCRPGYRYPCDCGEHDWHIGTAEARDKAREATP